MPPTTPENPKHSASKTEDEAILSKIDDSKMIPFESDDSIIPTVDPKPTAVPSGTNPTSTPTINTGNILADSIWNWIEEHIDVKWSRDSIKHDEAFEEIA